MRERGKGLAGARVSGHAREAMRRRGVALAEVRAMLTAPDQRLLLRSGRVACQSRVEWRFRACLLRAIVDVDRVPPQVVTVYRTHHIARHWRRP